MRGPELQLGVAGGAQPHRGIVAAREEIDAGERLRVAAVESLGEPNDGRQHPDGRSQRAVQFAEALVRLLRRRLAVIARDERNDLDFLGLESAQIAILDQVVRVPMMPLVADVDADVVQQRARIRATRARDRRAPCTLRVWSKMRQREPRDLLRVLWPVAAALAELDDAAAADVGVALDLADACAVAVDVVEDEAFAQREVAEREVVGAEAAQNRVEQDRAGDERSARRGSRPGMWSRSSMSASTSRLRKRWIALAPTRWFRMSSGGSPPRPHRERAEAENRARGANHAIEAGAPRSVPGRCPSPC